MCCRCAGPDMRIRIYGIWDDGRHICVRGGFRGKGRERGHMFYICVMRGFGGGMEPPLCLTC